MSGEDFDIVVVGGGPVGACAGALAALASAAAARRPLSVAVLEPSRPAAPQRGDRPDLRVSAISRASEHILRTAGAWDRVAERCSPYERMRVWHESVPPSGAGTLVFDSADVGEPNLGYIVENRLLQAALLEALENAGGRIEPARFAGVRIGERGVDVETDRGTLRARLVVGADGARSAVRDAIGLGADVADYGQVALVCMVETERAHEATAWQRFMRTGTVAYLPLADGTSSIVWSIDEGAAAGLAEASPEAFAAELARASDHVLGAVRLVSERACLPLRRVRAHRYSAHRCVLVGDAAHVVHPLAGQGVNLGLLDAAALAELLGEAVREGEDPGALRVLRRYERWRKSENELMGTAIDAFNRFLAHGAGPLSRLAQRGLGWVNRSREVKRFFMGRALGLAGELPRAARPEPAMPVRSAAGAGSLSSSGSGRSSPHR